MEKKNLNLGIELNLLFREDRNPEAILNVKEFLPLLPLPGFGQNCQAPPMKIIASIWKNSLLCICFVYSLCNGAI